MVDKNKKAEKRGSEEGIKTSRVSDERGNGDWGEFVYALKGVGSFMNRCTRSQVKAPKEFRLIR